MTTPEIYYCAAEIPTEVLAIIVRKVQTLAAPIRQNEGFDDYGLHHCAEYIRHLTRGGAVRDGVMYDVSNAGKCSMRLTADGQTRDYRKTPNCPIHGCAHDW